MLKKFSAFFLSLMLVFSSFCVFADSEKDVIWVSPNGNDSNTGFSEKDALLTLAKAKETVNSLLSENRGKPIEVVFKGGTYRFDETVKFTSSDSGKENQEVTYKGAEGENVVFKASKELDVTKFQKVKDYNILERLPQSARGKVYKLDLSEQGVSQLSTFVPPHAAKIEDVNFYFNGVEQTPAQWPNGEGNYSQYTKVLSSEELTSLGVSEDVGGVISYSDSQVERWTTAKDFYIEGFFGQEYKLDRCLVKNIDTTNKYVTLGLTEDSWKISNGTEGRSKRFKAINLLEELDVPGEWYIDRSKMILYYYPMGDLQNATLEIDECDKGIISISDCKYLNFENITFTQIRNNVISAYNSDSIDIRNCTFKYVNRAFNYYGKNPGSVDNQYVDKPTNYSYKNTPDGVYNSVIENNTFAYTAKEAFWINGGKRDTLESSGNVIKNNYFYKCSNRQRSVPAVSMGHGCGDIFENNIINNMHFQAVLYSGNNYIIRNNEIYNTNRETSDTGMIYAGRSFTERGSVISHNYIHDGNPIDERIAKSNNGIYWDDTLNGQTAENNIFENIQRAVCSNGSQDNSVLNNTFINCDFAYHLNDNFLGSDNIETLQSEGYSTVENNEYFKAQYTNMASLRTDPYKGQVAFNTVKGNTLYNSGKSLAGNFESSIFEFLDKSKKYKNVNENNTTVTARPNVDLSGIGIENGITIKEIYSDFDLVYPKNNSSAIGVNHFTWENSIGADKYKIVIATDKDFQNIVKETEVDYNYYDYDGTFEDNSVYYWKVTAINTSAFLNNNWECTKAFKFTTIPEKTEVDRTLIDNSYNKFNKIKLPNPNSIMYIRKGEWSYNSGYYNYINCCRWDAAYIDKYQMRNLVSSEGILTSQKTGTEYDFSCVIPNTLSPSARVTTDAAYTVEMGDKNYSSINFVATTRGQQGTADHWARYDVPNYNITIKYTDETEEAITTTIFGCQTNNDSIITTTKSVMGYGDQGEYDIFNMYEYSIPVDVAKTVKSITFEGNQTPISIFAITGVIKDPKFITAFDISEYCNSIATATADRHGITNALDCIDDVYQFDETAILKKLDNDYRIAYKDMVYDMSSIKNEKKAICKNNPVTVLTSDESYSKIGFVAGSNYYNSVIEDYPVTLTYLDGTTEEKTVKIGSNFEDTAGCDSIMGNVQARNLYDGTIAIGARLYSVTVDVNEDKLLKSVTFGKDGYNKNRIFIFAVSGMGISSFEMYDYSIKSTDDEKLESVGGYENSEVTISFLSKVCNPYQFIVSEYENNKFKNMTITECEGGIQRIEFNYVVPDNSTDKIKGFVWELDNLKPLLEDLKIK